MGIGGQSICTVGASRILALTFDNWGLKFRPNSRMSSSESYLFTAIACQISQVHVNGIACKVLAETDTLKLCRCSNTVQKVNQDYIFTNMSAVLWGLLANINLLLSLHAR